MFSVTGTVTIEGEGGSFLVTAAGSEVTIDVRMQRGASASALPHVPRLVRQLRAISQAVLALNLRVRLTRNGKTLASIGGTRPSGFLGRILRIERFRLGG